MIKLIRRRGSVNNTSIDLYNCDLISMPSKLEAIEIMAKYCGDQYASISHIDIRSWNDWKLQYNNIYFIDVLNKENYIEIYKKDSGLIGIKLLLYTDYLSDPSKYVVCNQAVLTAEDTAMNFERIAQTTCLELYDRNLEGLYHHSDYYDFPIKYEYHNKRRNNSTTGEENFNILYHEAKKCTSRLNSINEILELNKNFI